MEIIVANNAGACYGVNRSLKILKEAAKNDTVTATLGELIHNPIVVSELANEYNVSSVSSLDEAQNLNVENLVIRSHGVSLDIYKKAESLGLNIVDATCPYVKNVQNTASVLASLYPAVIIIGKQGHPEVESVSSFVKAQNTKCYIVETIQQVDYYLDELKCINDTVGVVSQTTQSTKVFEKLVDYLQEKGLKLEVENTICAATKKRQLSALELSKNVDAMIVIGGHNSSNTNHLADLCKKNCSQTYHIESIKELDVNSFADIHKLGITAGASTPKSQVDQIVNYITLNFSKK